MGTDKLVVLDKPSAHVTQVTLNKPDRLNSMSFGLVEALYEAIDEVAADNDTWVVVLTGAGRGFCSGLDLHDRGMPPNIEGLGFSRLAMRSMSYMGGVVPALRALPQPVVAAINGPAIGGGLCLALGADLRFAGESAYFANVGITNGLTGSELGITYLLPRSIGTANVAEILLTGRRFDAPDALRMGLVSRVVPDDELLAFAVETAEQMCELSPFGLQMTKQCMWANLEISSLQAAIDFENRNQLLAGYTGNLDEAIAAWREAKAGLRRVIDATAAARAHEAWHALETRCLVRAGGGQVLAKDGPKRGAPISAVWPFGQVIAAAAAMTGLGSIGPETVTPMLLGLERYRVGDGYGAFPGDRNRYYDDNAWIALDRLQLAILGGDAGEVDAAASVFGLLRKGEAASGGVYWVEGEASRNTCSTGPAAQVALRLHLATGEAHYLEFAQRQMAFLDGTLRDDEGLYRDHVRPDDTIEAAILSYNQGTPIGAAVLLARITGDHSWIERATHTAISAAAYFGRDDGWWRAPPVFNAIFFRNLLALLATAPDASLLRMLDDYLERAWAEGRHRRSGLFVAGGIGSYDGNPTIDHAGLTQLYAFRAWSSERWEDIC